VREGLQDSMEKEWIHTGGVLMGG